MNVNQAYKTHELWKIMALCLQMTDGNLFRTLDVLKFEYGVKMTFDELTACMTEAIINALEQQAYD